MLAKIVEVLVYGVTGTPTTIMHEISLYGCEDICGRPMAGSTTPVRDILVAAMTFTKLLTNRQYLPSPELRSIGLKIARIDFCLWFMRRGITLWI
jgi:hypothetical protein